MASGTKRNRTISDTFGKEALLSSLLETTERKVVVLDVKLVQKGGSTQAIWIGWRRWRDFRRIEVDFGRLPLANLGIGNRARGVLWLETDPFVPLRTATIGQSPARMEIHTR